MHAGDAHVRRYSPSMVKVTAITLLPDEQLRSAASHDVLRRLRHASRIQHVRRLTAEHGRRIFDIQTAQAAAACMGVWWQPLAYGEPIEDRERWRSRSRVAAFAVE